MTNNLYFEVKADFLNTPLNAKVLKKDKLTMLLVEPQDVAATDGVSVSELIKKLKGDAGSIGDSFEGDANSIKIKLSMAYLKYLKTEDTGKAPEGEATTGMEYALKLEVLDINTLPIFKKIGDIITVNSVTLAVWNTDDVSVTSKMNLAIPAFTNKAIS